MNGQGICGIYTLWDIIQWLKDGNPGICDNMVGPEGTMLSKPDRESIVWSLLLYDDACII